MNRNELLSILATSLIGIVYVLFFAGKDPVLLIVFGLQTLRSGLALRNLVKKTNLH